MDRALLSQHDRPDEPRAELTWAARASPMQEAGPAARSQQLAPERWLPGSSTPLSLV